MHISHSSLYCKSSGSITAASAGTTCLVDKCTQSAWFSKMLHDPSSSVYPVRCHSLSPPVLFCFGTLCGSTCPSSHSSDHGFLGSGLQQLGVPKRPQTDAQGTVEPRAVGSANQFRQHSLSLSGQAVLPSFQLPQHPSGVFDISSLSFGHHAPFMDVQSNTQSYKLNQH